jgi:GT2 family glycosyltransferase
MAPETLAIVIATKDRPSDIKRCLESIARQTRLPDQIVVVDQSRARYELDSSARLLHVYDPSLSGASAARIVGIALTHADIVLFLDDDVELLPKSLEALMEGFAAQPDAVGLQCLDVLVHEEGRATRLLDFLFERGPFSKRSYRVDGTEYRRWLAGYGMAFRSVVFKTDLLDETLAGYSLGEDWEFSQRARQYGALRVAAGAELLHHQSTVNRERSRHLNIRRWNNYHYFFQKLNFGRDFRNRIWLFWWEIGETYRWFRCGMGLPFLHRPETQLTVQGSASPKNTE